MKVTLSNPDKLAAAVAAMTAIQSSPSTARPLVAAALDAIGDGDATGGILYLDAAAAHTLTGRRATAAAADLLRAAFTIDTDEQV